MKGHPKKEHWLNLNLQNSWFEFGSKVGARSQILIQTLMSGTAAVLKFVPNAARKQSKINLQNYWYQQNIPHYTN